MFAPKDRVAIPPFKMILASLFKHLVPKPHNRHDLAPVPLFRREVTDCGMTMIGVVPVNACAMSVNAPDTLACISRS
jgi:hypothetical protein